MISQNRPVVPPTRGDAGFNNFSQIIQKNLADLHEIAHVHKIVTAFPGANDGTIGDIYIVQTPLATYLAVKTNDGWTAQSSGIVNIATFGVAGDGTDESAKVQAAVDFVSDGDILFFPAGTYRFSVTYQSGNQMQVMGAGLGTIFTPIDATHFVFNGLGTFTAKSHIFMNFQVKGFGDAQGRGIYVNNAAFNNFENVTFDNLEYCVYSNSTEWNHYINCHFREFKYGVIATTLNSDILGNPPTLMQNPNYQYFLQCHFWGGSYAGFSGGGIGFYWDNKDDAIGDHGSANFFYQCEFLNNLLGVASGDAGNDARFNSLHLIDCFLNNNNSPAGGTQTFNGFTLNNGDMSIMNGTVHLDNTHFEDNLSFLGNCRVVGSNVQILASAGTGVTIARTAVVNIDNMVGDQNGGWIFDQIRTKNPQIISSSRPMTIRLPSARTAFTSTLFKNVVSTDTTTCALGSLPPAYTGSPTISFEQGNGFYANTAVKVVGTTGDGVKWRANLTSGKYYVTTFSMRTTSQVTVDITNLGEFLTGNSGTLHLSSDWRTFGAISLSGFTGTATIAFLLNGSTTLYVSCVQVCEFDDRDAALDFIDSQTFALIPSEVSNREFSASASPTTGTWNRGDITWNNAPTSGGFVGWVCTVAGSPGTWKTFGAIS